MDPLSDASLSTGSTAGGSITSAAQQHDSGVASPASELPLIPPHDEDDGDDASSSEGDGSISRLSPLSTPHGSPDGAAALVRQPPPPRGSSPVPIAAPRSTGGSSNGGGGGSNRGGLPDPQMSEERVRALLAATSPQFGSEGRFSMAEFAARTRQAMTAAARRELVGGAPGDSHAASTPGGGATGGGRGDADEVVGALDDAGHAADVARQAAHLASLTAAVAEEGKVNKELAALLVERLEASRKAVECLMRLLSCLMEAEAAYSAAMAAAAKTASAGPLAAPSDASSLVAALDGMVALPAAAAAGHRQLYLQLQLLADSARSLWRRYTAAAKDLKQAVQTVHRSIDGCCKQLMASLADHQAACEAFDAAVVWQGPPSHILGSSGLSPRQQRWHRRTSSAELPAGRHGKAGSSWGGAAAAAAAGAANAAAGVAAAAVLRPRFSAAPSRDPWTSEGRLVAEQEALKRWQDQERELLQKGFESLQVLEAERIADLLEAGQALSAAYPAAVQSLPPAAEALRLKLGGLGGAGEAGLQQLAKTAAEMRATSEELALRQAESLESVSQELFCSPEIIRQGCMELWQPRSSEWQSCHFVLTRAGFLHWFKSMQGTAPLEPPLNLSRCDFEAGQAPAFHLVEAGSGGWLVGRGSRKVTLKAGSVEECCEWAIALREAIALITCGGGAGSRT